MSGAKANPLDFDSLNRSLKRSMDLRDSSKAILRASEKWAETGRSAHSFLRSHIVVVPLLLCFSPSLLPHALCFDLPSFLITDTSFHYFILNCITAYSVDLTDFAEKMLKFVTFLEANEELGTQTLTLFFALFHHS